MCISHQLPIHSILVPSIIELFNFSTIYINIIVLMATVTDNMPGAVPTNDMPDMDDLLDQLERDESDQQQQRQQHHQRIKEQRKKSELKISQRTSSVAEPAKPHLDSPPSKQQAELKVDEKVVTKKLEEMEDLFDQIDRMDARIQSEEASSSREETSEEASQNQTKQAQASDSPDIIADNKLPPAIVSSSPLDRFVNDMVDRLLDQALMDSHTLYAREPSLSTRDELLPFYEDGIEDEKEELTVKAKTKTTTNLPLESDEISSIGHKNGEDAGDDGDNNNEKIEQKWGEEKQAEIGEWEKRECQPTATAEEEHQTPIGASVHADAELLLIDNENEVERELPHEAKCEEKEEEVEMASSHPQLGEEELTTSPPQTREATTNIDANITDNTIAKEEVTTSSQDDVVPDADDPETALMIEELEAQLRLEEQQEEEEKAEQQKQIDRRPAEDQKEAEEEQQPAQEPKLSSPQKRPELAIVHDLSIAQNEFKLTESELTLGKRKPFWIPDEDCPNCMLCSNRFSMVNRRHHCRACGRVLCRVCCSQRRQLLYMDEREGRQRVCVPCNRTLDRIDEYERRMAEATTEQQRREAGEGPSSSTNSAIVGAGNSKEKKMAQSCQKQQRTNGFDSEPRDQRTAEQESATRTNSSSSGPKRNKSLLKPPRLPNGSSGADNPQNGDNSAASGDPFSPQIQLDGQQTAEEQMAMSTDDDKMRWHRPSNLVTQLEPSRNELLADGQPNQQSSTPNESQKQQRITSTSSSASSSKRRGVTFRDGVNPGQETPGSSPSISSSTGGPAATALSAPSPMLSPYQWLISSSARANNSTGSNSQQQQQNAGTPTAEANSSNNNNNGGTSGGGKKLPRKVSRRIKERRVQEEQASLLQLDHWRICVLVNNGGQQHRLGGELQPRGLDQVVADLLPEKLAQSSPTKQQLTSSSVCVAVRRNFHVRVEWRKQFPMNNQQSVDVLSFCTRGMAAVGVDELMLVLQFDRSKFANPEDIESELFNTLEQFEQIFLSSLNPFEESMDHRMGIRKCANRMRRLYHPLAKRRRTLMGHPAAALYFHRPQGPEQLLTTSLSHPSTPFLLGAIVRDEELSWARCVPSRLLLRLGQLTGQYPTPLVNMFREEPMFTRMAVQSSVLKVLNDFRNWTYQMAQLSGTAIAVRDELTEVCLPSLALDEVRALVESNRNMVGWALNELAPAEQQMEVDSHLVCEQQSLADNSQFCTRIFSRNQNAPRKVTGASFVIFDGALKGGEQFLVSVVEDGLVVRLQADLMEELVKALLAGDLFSATNSQGHQLSVRFHTQQPLAKEIPGALVSPIDGQPLDGQFQYGLLLERQLYAFNFFQYSTEWALRLSNVINMLPGKWPTALQPRFFDVCEQLAQQVANTVEPFLHELVAANQLSIALRIHVDEDSVSYDTERWTALPDQHFVWTVTLDEQIIPFLYSLCAWVPSGLHVELHMPILSIRPLPAMNVLPMDSPTPCAPLNNDGQSAEEPAKFDNEKPK